LLFRDDSSEPYRGNPERSSKGFSWQQDDQVLELPFVSQVKGVRQPYAKFASVCAKSRTAG
jgi:hypothetical protein